MNSPSARDLYLRHRPVIYRFLRNSTGDEALAEDLTQDTFLRALRGLATYESREHERAWLFRIARRLLLDHRRSVERRPRIADGADIASEGRGPVAVIVTTLTDALQSLEPTEREAFLLREQGGLGYAEIAAVVSCTPDAVRNRIYRARSTLRRLLAPTLVEARKRSNPETNHE